MTPRRNRAALSAMARTAALCIYPGCTAWPDDLPLWAWMLARGWDVERWGQA